MGFSTEGKGETNNPVAINVGVGPASDKDCVQAESNIEVIISVTIASDTRFLLLMDSPLLDSTNDGSTSPLKRQAASCFCLVFAELILDNLCIRYSQLQKLFPAIIWPGGFDQGNVNWHIHNRGQNMALHFC
jgi:hypothetical protein